RGPRTARPGWRVCVYAAAHQRYGSGPADPARDVDDAAIAGVPSGHRDGIVSNPSLREIRARAVSLRCPGPLRYGTGGKTQMIVEATKESRFWPVLRVGAGNFLAMYEFTVFG